MDNLFANLLERAKKDRNILRKLKVIATEAQQYELGAELRSIEVEHFPETEYTKNAKAEGEKVSQALAMVGLGNIPAPTSWLISQTLKLHTKKGSKFSLMDASDLKLQCKTIFDFED